MSKRQQIRQLIAKGRLDEAISYVMAVAQGSRLVDEVILLSGRWHQLERDRRLGVLSGNEVSLGTNRLAHTLLQFLDEMEDEPNISWDQQLASTGSTISPVLTVIHTDQHRAEAERLEKLVGSLMRTNYLSQIQRLELPAVLPTHPAPSTTQAAPSLVLMLVSSQAVELLRDFLLRVYAKDGQASHHYLAVLLDTNDLTWLPEREDNRIQVLPTNHKPLSEWSIADEGYLAVFMGLKDYIKAEVGIKPIRVNIRR